VTSSDIWKIRVGGRPVPVLRCRGGEAATSATTVRPVTLEDLAAELRRFATDRDWQQFHTPKNLAISLAVEVGELLEHFQWGSDEEVADRFRTADGRAAISEEMADVLIYLVRLADILGIDLLEAAAAKIAANAERYPADEVRGSSAKRAH
jgi:dCTP diphosphatase